MRSGSHGAGASGSARPRRCRGATAARPPLLPCRWRFPAAGLDQLLTLGHNLFQPPHPPKKKKPNKKNTSCQTPEIRYRTHHLMLPR